MNENTLEAMRREIIHVAKRRQTISYQILASRLGFDANPGWHNLIWEYLDEINRRETSNRRPMLTAMVVTEADGEPGKGFWKCAYPRRWP